MPKRKEPELDPKEQFKRFQETAKELGVDGQDAVKRMETDFAKLSKSIRHEASRASRRAAAKES